MAHVLVYYTLLVVIIICIMFVKLRKCWRKQSVVSLGTPETSAIQKLSIIIILVSTYYYYDYIRLPVVCTGWYWF